MENLNPPPFQPEFGPWGLNSTRLNPFFHPKNGFNPKNRVGFGRTRWNRPKCFFHPPCCCLLKQPVVFHLYRVRRNFHSNILPITQLPSSSSEAAGSIFQSSLELLSKSLLNWLGPVVENWVQSQKYGHNWRPFLKLCKYSDLLPSSEATGSIFQSSLELQSKSLLHRFGPDIENLPLFFNCLGIWFF